MAATATAVLQAPDSRLQSKASWSPLGGFYREGSAVQVQQLVQDTLPVATAYTANLSFLY